MTCFSIVFRFVPDLDQSARNELLESFIVEAVEQNGLQFGGGGAADVWDGCAESASRTDDEVSAEQRDRVISWLSSHPLVLDHEVGPVFEAKAIDEAFLEKLSALTQAVENGRPTEEIQRLADGLDCDE